MKTQNPSLTRLALLDLFTFVSLAACIALSVGLVLAGTVLLLSGSAQAAQHERDGGLLLMPRAGGAVLTAPLLATDVEIQVVGHVARAKVTQRFRNTQPDWYEGTYVFPLPEDAAVDRLRMRIGERLVEGEIREKEKARATYAQAKAEGRRAALLEQERPNIFTSSVANIAPGEEVQIEIEYQQTLRYDQGRYSLRFPMVVGPRYFPAAEAKGSDAARVTTALFRPASKSVVRNPVTLRVDVHAGVSVAELRSPSHRIETGPCGEAGCRAVLHDPLSSGTPANKDFVLEWTLESGRVPAAAAITELKHGRHYGLVMVVPPAQASPDSTIPREAIFVIDTSGSMQGASIAQAKEALELAVRRLAPVDRFNIIEFNSHARPLFAEARAASPDNLEASIRWVRDLRANGGTEMARALDLALDGKETPGRIRQIVFLTDGAVGNEDQLFRMIRERLGDSRLFTVGIGSAPNSHFMSRAARFGAGSFTYIGRIEEVKQKMDALFSKLESPVLKGVRIDWGGAVGIEAWPKQVPDLYAGEPVMVLFSAEKLGGALTVSATAGDKAWMARVPVAPAESANALSVLWARERIGALMDGMREGVPEDDIREAVLKLALEHQLVSRYTSLVAVDKTPARTAEALLKSASLPTNLPEGWTMEGNVGQVHGELPRGATSARFDLLLGSLLLLLGLLLYRRSQRWE
ncbi:MAG: marine proteobacterial sortase target protein [Betaproteobacteria bacterium]